MCLHHTFESNVSQRGFSLIELVAVMIIIGVLAAVAMPKLNSNDIKPDVFRDQVELSMRYAQKAAVSHRRLVCATFTAANVTPSSVTMTMASTNPVTACGTANFPDSTATTYLSSPEVSFQATQTTVYFQPNGTITSDAAGATPADVSLTINGSTRTVNLTGLTGYVG
jgi:MSHA pilin protein MshC